MTWTAHTTGRALTWVLRDDTTDAAMVAMVSVLPGTVTHPDLWIAAIVHGLNNPPPIEGFGGRAGEMLDARRQTARATMLGNTARDEP